MGEAKIFLIPCETNILHPVIRIEVTDPGLIDEIPIRNVDGRTVCQLVLY